MNLNNLTKEDILFVYCAILKERGFKSPPTEVYTNLEVRMSPSKTFIIVFDSGDNVFELQILSNSGIETIMYKLRGDRDLFVVPENILDVIKTTQQMRLKENQEKEQPKAKQGETIYAVYNTHNGEFAFAGKLFSSIEQIIKYLNKIDDVIFASFAFYSSKSKSDWSDVTTLNFESFMKHHGVAILEIPTLISKDNLQNPKVSLSQNSINKDTLLWKVHSTQHGSVPFYKGDSIDGASLVYNILCAIL